MCDKDMFVRCDGWNQYDYRIEHDISFLYV